MFGVLPGAVVCSWSCYLLLSAVYPSTVLRCSVIWSCCLVWLCMYLYLYILICVWFTVLLYLCLYLCLCLAHSPVSGCVQHYICSCICLVSGVPAVWSPSSVSVPVICSRSQVPAPVHLTVWSCCLFTALSSDLFLSWLLFILVLCPVSCVSSCVVLCTALQT